jgi:hypothetical protein
MENLEDKEEESEIYQSPRSQRSRAPAAIARRRGKRTGWFAFLPTTPTTKILAKAVQFPVGAKTCMDAYKAILKQAVLVGKPRVIY